MFKLLGNNCDKIRAVLRIIISGQTGGRNAVFVFEFFGHLAVNYVKFSRNAKFLENFAGFLGFGTGVYKYALCYCCCYFCCCYCCRDVLQNVSTSVRPSTQRPSTQYPTPIRPHPQKKIQNPANFLIPPWQRGLGGFFSRNSKRKS